MSEVEEEIIRELEEEMISEEEENKVEEDVRKVSKVWYLVAFLFGLLGGIIGYVATRDDDIDVAYSCIWIGLFTTIIGILTILWLTYSLSIG